LLVDISERVIKQASVWMANIWSNEAQQTWDHYLLTSSIVI